MRNFFNLPQAGFGAKGKRWSPRIGVSTGRITRSRRRDNTETPNALRSERHFCVKILGNLGTQAPLKRALEPVSYIEPQRDSAWVCGIFSGRRRTGRWYR